MMEELTEKMGSGHGHERDAHGTGGLTFRNAIAELDRWREVAERNGPIFRKEGETKEADLCAEVAREYSAAIAVLREAERIGGESAGGTPAPRPRDTVKKGV